MPGAPGVGGPGRPNGGTLEVQCALWAFSQWIHLRRVSFEEEKGRKKNIPEGGKATDSVPDI